MEKRKENWICKNCKYPNTAWIGICKICGKQREGVEVDKIGRVIKKEV